LFALLIVIGTYSLRDLNLNVNLSSFDHFSKTPITNIKIEGGLRYLSKLDVQASIVAVSSEGFLTLNINDFKNVLLADPWLRNVSVSREWPSSIRVVLEEEQPIARWGDSAFLNSYGEIIRVRDLSQLQELPVLWGKENEAYSIAKDYLTMSRLLNDQGLYISSLDVTENGAWNLELNRAFNVKLGARDLSQRVDRFLYLYRRQLEPVAHDLAVVDVRYQNGIAVSWKELKHSLSSTELDKNKIVSR